MRVLDLFSGIGGFSLGLERAGMRTVGFCELDPYCRGVLARHWPNVPCHDDIRTFSGIPCDLICGGFPCQDISVAGKGAGLAGSRSGLWWEYHRLICDLRPRWVLVENVSALLSRGLGEVLTSLAQIGYDAEWHCIPASHVGAPHLRDRIWIVAYPNGYGALGGRRHPDSPHVERHDAEEIQERKDIKPGAECPSEARGNPNGLRELQPKGGEPYKWGRAGDPDWWTAEPDVGRMAHGVPARVDRIKALGNAVVPQVVELIGRAIMRLETT